MNLIMCAVCTVSSISHSSGSTVIVMSHQDFSPRDETQVRAALYNEKWRFLEGCVRDAALFWADFETTGSEVVRDGDRQAIL
jgi:hypothetical protein